MWTRELEPAGVRVTTVRAGQMYDETKTGSNWPADVARRFAEANARIGLNLRERGASHYDAVTDVFRAVLDTPRDVHLGLVTVSARKPTQT
jgi:meso-butanediol dehydrogenase/(S,S)-butanediol dehydrogenase/diacetyl reductase